VLINYFNEAAPGFDGKDILQKLGGAVPEVKERGPLQPGQTVTGTAPVKEEEQPQTKPLWQRLPQTMLPPELR
jgi:hypothetical protein